MTKISDIQAFFEAFAPTDSAMDFDNVGLLVGDRDTEIKKVLIALDITSEVVYEAEKMGCELIISHHPVIFNPIKRLSSASVPYLLAAKGISAICMHTNLDLSEELGVNTCLANACGVDNPKLSELGECMFVGTLESEADIDAFAQTVKTNLSCKGLRYTRAKRHINTVAVSSGAGGSNVFSAHKAGADVLITGEIKHHEIIAANELGISIIDAGHFKTEDIVILPLKQRLEKEFAEVSFFKSDVFDDGILFL